MLTKDQAIRVFNALIQTNIDRIEGYEKALNESDDLDIDLESIFAKMINESRRNISELCNEVAALGGQSVSHSSFTSKVHKIWIDVKSTFNNRDIESLLDTCEFGEDAALEAYENALQTDAELTIGQLNLITRQKAGIQLAHNLVKQYRDMHETVTR